MTIGRLLVGKYIELTGLEVGAAFAIKRSILNLSALVKATMMTIKYLLLLRSMMTNQS
jgi:hypothetical protein